MNFYSVGITKYPHTLTTLAVVTMHYSIYYSLSQNLKGILWNINSFKTLHTRSHSNIPTQKQLSPIYQLLKRACHYSTISISTSTDRFMKQNVCSIALDKK